MVQITTYIIGRIASWNVNGKAPPRSRSDVAALREWLLGTSEEEEQTLEQQQPGMLVVGLQEVRCLQKKIF